MSSSSLSSYSSSSYNYSEQNSSKIELKNNKDSYYQYQKEREKLHELFKKGKMLKFKYDEKKAENIESRKKFIEEKVKNKEKTNRKKSTKIKNENSINKKNDSKECNKYHKIIKQKNFFYHDAFIHDGENLSFKQKQRALKTYIKKKTKKMNIIYSDIMDNAKRLKLSSINTPELLHIEKIGFQIMKINEKK